MKNKGFTLLFASLVVSLILSIGLAIAHITLSQLLLSSAGRDSQFAFYNADSGIECALYHEFNVRHPDGSFIFPVDEDDVPANTTKIECNGFNPPDLFYDDPSSSATTSTFFTINPPGGSCTGANKTKPTFRVKVDKSPRDAFSNYVHIESRGYNTCDTTNPRRVERGLYVKFID